MSIWRTLLGLPPKKENKAIARRSYHAASTSRLFADFMSSNRSADSELKPDLVLMRNRSRELARNDVYTRRYLNLMKTNVIGESGMTLQVKARNADGSLDVIGNDIVENAWYQFGMLGNCTADGKMSWVDLQKYCVEAMKRDGEAFFQILRNPTFKHGIAIQPLEADLIDEQKNERLKNGHEIRMGIELDTFKRPVAYWVRQRHPGDYDYNTLGLTNSVRVEADKIIHVFNPLRAGQTRGEPAMVTAISQIKMLNAHREAELVASRMAASKMGFFTSESGEDMPADDYENGTVPLIDAEPGTFHQLPAGVDFKPFDPTHPATAFAEFQKGILRGIASGLGVSYASLSNDLEGTSYSSIRQGALEERDAYRDEQQFFRDHFVLPAYAIWLNHVMSFNLIPIPATKFEKFFMASTFRARGWQWVDPQKEVNAAVTAMHNGIMSMQDVSAQYGRDVEETFSQWQRDKEVAASFGLEMAFEPFGAPEASKGVEAPAPAPVAEAPQRNIEIVQIPAPPAPPPMEILVKMPDERKPAKRSIKLVRDENGLVTGAEALED